MINKENTLINYLTITFTMNIHIVVSLLNNEGYTNEKSNRLGKHVQKKNSLLIPPLRENTLNKAIMFYVSR